MIRVELSEDEVALAKKLAEARCTIKNPTKNYKYSTNSTDIDLHIMSVACHIAVAKAFDLTYKQHRDPSNRKRYIIEFYRDKCPVALWIKGKRFMTGSNSDVLFRINGLYPTSRVPLILCQCSNLYLVTIVGWMFSDLLKEARKRITNMHGEYWAVPTSQFNPIETFEQVFTSMLDKLSPDKPWRPEYLTPAQIRKRENR